jgi:hypothetical protein
MVIFIKLSFARLFCKDNYFFTIKYNIPTVLLGTIRQKRFAIYAIFALSDPPKWGCN